MGQAIPRQHPAVVLRTHYNHLRALLAVAMIAVAGLTVAVVILANDSDQVRSTSVARPIESLNHGDLNPAMRRPDSTSTRYDGGPEEGTRGVVAARQPGVRYDGGPKEGTAALTQRSAPATSDHNPINSPPGVRYDGGPEEGTRGALSSGAGSNPAPGTRYDGGPEEGSKGISH
jgi:hypothetical protein